MPHVMDRPIGDYALLSDCHSAALVSSEGSIDWFCLPRFDSPSIFGRLLDAAGGHWSIRPWGEYRTRRRYLPESLVLETEFETPRGVVLLTDALVFAHDERGHEIGRDAPHVLVRVVRVTQGEVPIEIEFAPRPEYGLVHPHLSASPDGLVVRGGAAQALLAGPPAASVKGGTARWQVRPSAGGELSFALQYEATWDGDAKPWNQRQINRRLAETVKGWQSWSALHQRYHGPWQEEVRHSGRVLQALTYRPTSSIVAAPTTSLPETAGGTRNWDYRYAWIRDASMTMQALWVAACPDEAGRFFAFITRAAGLSLESGTGMQIMYGVGGEHDLSERELPHLGGWRGSAPVRVGNAAWQQEQTDIYGALLDAVWCVRDQLGSPDPRVTEFLAQVVDVAAVAWEKPDQGIWELRGPPRHFLHSKLMCWVALDRAIGLAGQIGMSHRVPDWTRARHKVWTAMLDRGWNERVGAFTQSFGSDTIDASVLMLAITGFLPAADPKMRSTIERVASHLEAPGGLIYRYRDEDGIAGDEAPFVLCSYWLAECWALAGELSRATEAFERVTAYANDVGLLSEQADPATGELLGNFPQAFSHIGLVNAAQAIAAATQ